MHFLSVSVNVNTRKVERDTLFQLSFVQSFFRRLQTKTDLFSSLVKLPEGPVWTHPGCVREEQEKGENVLEREGRERNCKFVLKSPQDIPLWFYDQSDLRCVNQRKRN